MIFARAEQVRFLELKKVPVVLETRLSVGFESPLSAVPGMAEQLETFLAEPEQVVGQCSLGLHTQIDPLGSLFTYSITLDARFIVADLPAVFF